ncbi:hypothetical protein RRG08_060854 [Elysia crispata]|uniref:Uncharacterized protein n=1 Tax=Elysia crispata TaxID=231223 RepID=A0AAE0ZHK0_9GAST|nr:hypothetical protein RRG08_060854 [Elysia crispata]
MGRGASRDQRGQSSDSTQTRPGVIEQSKIDIELSLLRNARSLMENQGTNSLIWKTKFFRATVVRTGSAPPSTVTLDPN